MKKAATLVVLFFVVLTASAQTKVIDSLKHLLAVSKTDTDRVKIYIQAVWSGRYTLDSNFLYAKQAFALAEKIKYKDGSARAQLALGFLFTGRGNYSKALTYLLAALK